VPASLALAGLMCFNAARLPARVNQDGALILFSEQDRTHWNRELIAKGFALLEASASGDELSDYHVEAAIASVHAEAPHLKDTDWRRIIALYDLLLTLKPSPVVALGRAIAVAEADGPERGLEELSRIAAPKSFDDYPFYQAALGELKLRCGFADSARGHFEAASAAARNGMERDFLLARARACG
jgi:RNA polymerase sigma-70 factor (ECF subfamily)